MFKAQLFIGFAFDGPLSHALNKLDNNLVAHFIQAGDNYLQQAEHQGMKYLGKYAETITDIPALELLESNVRSLLKRLLPDYPFHENPVWILPVLEQSNPIV